jgi:ATP-dependent DNA helicase RecG
VLPGVGPTTVERARALGIDLVGGLLGHLPVRYEAFDAGVRPVAGLTAGEEATVRVRLDDISVQRTRRRSLRLVRARVHDDSGRMAAVWFNQQHLARVLSPGDELLLRGRIAEGRREMAVRSHEVLGGRGSEGVHTQGLVPVYPATEQLQPRRIRELVDLARPLAWAAPERLPEWVRTRLRIGGIADALMAVHFPRSRPESRAGRRRLVAEELLVLQLGLLAVRRRQERTSSAPALRATGEHSRPLLEALPFELTAEQRHAAREIARDLARPRPMRRLLQGEVGSGKTLVALRAMLRVVDSGGQAALLAPTEVLAQQHHRSVTGMLGDLAQGGMLGGADEGTTVVLLTGSMTKAQRQEALLRAASGEAGIVIGTHVLLEEHVSFADLGLVVVDEQHRFGVEQRAALTDKAGTPPHVLVMTATPIPRTVAMTVFGDLETSILTELPAGRSPIQTNVVPLPDQPAWLGRVWQRVAEEVGKGHQVYVVCPRISGDEPEQGERDVVDVDEEGRPVEQKPPMYAVEELAAELADGPLAALRVAVLHGRLTPEEKDRTMRAFAAAEIDVLVSTTVIEVGVDVPNATAMVIMDADRFGVSQLHQLRGRVGRGGLPGLCLLVTNAPAATPARERLEAVAATTDGFELSRVDLELRREGDVLGSSQSGFRSSLQNLRVLRDEDTIVAARGAAEMLLEEDPALLAAPELAAAVAAMEHSRQSEFMEKS